MVVVDDDKVKLSYSVKGGFAFLHLEVRDWSLSGYKRIKKSVNALREDLSRKGHSLVFATTDDEKITKLWQRVHPLEELTTFGHRDEYWIGAWEVEDD